MNGSGGDEEKGNGDFERVAGDQELGGCKMCTYAGVHRVVQVRCVHVQVVSYDSALF